MRKSDTPAAVGGSSLLVIFAVLCLTVFALLSLSTVQADGRLTAVSVNAAKDYYEADTRAEELLAEIRSGNLPEGVEQKGDIYKYSCPVSKTQVLQVTVRADENGYEVLQWQTVSSVGWEADDNLHVWDGQTIE